MRVYIITSAKFEECYIEEWVQYHLNIGFDKIIINDNNPKDYKYQLKDILKKYIDAGQVIIERYYDMYIHEGDPEEEFPKIYTCLYNKYKDEFDWCAKLDIDEYLEIPETNNDVKKFLSQKKFNNVLSICIPSNLYCIKEEYKHKYTRLKNNKYKFENITDNEKYIKRWHFKSIIKSDPAIKYVLHHEAEFNNQYIEGKLKQSLPNGDSFLGRFLFDGINKDTVNFSENETIVALQQKKYFKYLSNICKINHYHSKSYEEYINRILKFEGNIEGNIYTNDWKSFCERHKGNKKFEFRDLYKLYFIDNINNIED